MDDAGCAADAVCRAGRCVGPPLQPGDKILALTFDDAESVEAWPPMADAQAEGVSWAEDAGVAGGALRISAANSDAVGRAFIFEYNNRGIDYGGSRAVDISVALKLGALENSAIHAQLELPGVGLINELDLQNRGLNEANWTTLNFRINNVDPNGRLFRLHFNFAARGNRGLRRWYSAGRRYLCFVGAVPE